MCFFDAFMLHWWGEIILVLVRSCSVEEPSFPSQWHLFTTVGLDGFLLAYSATGNTEYKAWASTISKQPSNLQNAWLPSALSFLPTGDLPKHPDKAFALAAAVPYSSFAEARMIILLDFPLCLSSPFQLSQGYKWKFNYSRPKRSACSGYVAESPWTPSSSHPWWWNSLSRLIAFWKGTKDNMLYVVAKIEFMQVCYLWSTWQTFWNHVSFRKAVYVLSWRWPIYYLILISKPAAQKPAILASLRKYPPKRERSI